MYEDLQKQIPKPKSAWRRIVRPPLNVWEKWLFSPDYWIREINEEGSWTN